MPTESNPDWDEANRRRQAERLTEIQQRLRQEQARMATGQQHVHQPLADYDQIQPPPPQPLSPVEAFVGTTTTWNEPPGLVDIDIGNGLDAGISVTADPPFYTYTTTAPAIDKETLKEALKEVLGEMFDEDVNFINWLRLKYTLIPVANPEKKTKKRRKRNVNRPISQSVPASRAGLTGSAIGNAGNTLGATLTGASAGSATLRVAERGPQEYDTPPDQGSR